jgi:hypothetical protein
MLFASITVSGSGYNIQGNALHFSIVTVQPNTIFQVDAINTNTLTIGSGATVTIQAISGGPLAETMESVPEPSSATLFAVAGAAALLCLGSKRRRSQFKAIGCRREE